MLALPYVGRKVSQCYCGWLISTATAAIVLLTVSSVPTMVSIAQRTQVWVSMRMCVMLDACLPPYTGEGGALIVVLLYTAR